MGYALKDLDSQDGGGTEFRRTLITVGKMMAMGADHIRSIVAKHSKSKPLPPVLPQDLVLQRPSEFNVVFLEDKERFQSLKLEAFLVEVESEFRKLKLAEDTEDEIKRGLRRWKRKKRKNERSNAATAS